MIPAADLERNLPEELKRERHWVGWAPDPDNGRPKCPVVLHARQRRASTRKPETWGNFDRALLFLQKYGEPGKVGIGYVLTGSLIYVDIDCALDESGEPREWARKFIEPFIGKAYIERSPSGRGLHILCKGTLPKEGGTAKFPQHAQADGRVPEVAMFTSGKYTTITGDVWKQQKRMKDATQEAAGVWAAAGISAVGSSGEGTTKAPTDAELVSVERVPKAVMAELKKCSVMDAPDRSSARFKFYCEAARAGLNAEEIFSVVLSSEWYKQSGAEEKGRDHTWADISRAVAKLRASEQMFEAVKEEGARESQNWKELGISVTVQMTKAGPVTSAVYGMHNMVQVLTRHPSWKGRFRLNEFKDRLELDEKGFEDGGIAGVAEALRRVLQWEREPQLDLVWRAIEAVCRANRFNPVKSWLEGLTWDGTSRLGRWLVDAGCEDSKLNELIGRKWLISLVARAMEPGCKVDTVLILEGGQGTLKSTLFRQLAGGTEYFTDTHVGVDKDGMMLVHGRWIVELAELAIFKRAERDVVKQFLAAQEDSYRPPYGRTVVTQPRHFVIVGSTNDTEYLTDPSGARRFWPVRVVRRLQMPAERDQLFAEAVKAYKDGEPWWFDEMPEELVEAHDLRFVDDSMKDRVGMFLQEAGAAAAFTIPQVMERIGMPVERKDLAMRVADVLKREGYAKRKITIDGKRVMMWSRSGVPALVVSNPSLEEILADPAPGVSGVDRYGQDKKS
jgi:predicted P-loop ATPase